MARILLLLLLAVMAIAALAPGKPASSRALPMIDIVLAIDHSGSMNSESDVNGERLRAALRLIEAMAASRDAVSVRIGVVGFGSPAIRPIPLVSELRDVNDASLRQALQRLDLPGTDYRSALCLSWAAVSLQRPPGDSGCDPRLVPLYDAALRAPQAEPGVTRVVVLLTDGEPSPDGATHRFAQDDHPSRCQSSLSFAHNEMCGVSETWRKLTQQTNVVLGVIGLDRQDSWFSSAEPYFLEMACRDSRPCPRVIRSSDPSSLTADLLRAAAEVFYNLCTRTTGPHNCTIPASVSEANFLISGTPEPDSVRIFDSSGNPVQRGPNVIVNTTATGESWRVLMPPKGTWRVESIQPNASLDVAVFYSLQKFQMTTVPANPEAGNNVNLVLEMEGEPSIDVKSLLNETLELKLQRGGDQPSVRKVNLSQGNAPARFQIDNALTNAQAGSWEAFISLEVNRVQEVLASRRFEVRQATAASPTPTSSPAPTATPAPPPCQATLVAGAGREQSTHSATFVVGYPLRFHKSADIEASINGAGCARSAGGLHGRLAVSGPPACKDAPCYRDATGDTPLGLRLPLSQLGSSLDGTTLQRSVSIESDGSWQELANGEVRLDTPTWVKLERISRVGYWLPWALLVGVLAAVSTLGTYDKHRSLVLRKAGYYNNATGRTQPVVKGIGVWLRLKDGPQPRLLTRKYLIAGPLVIRSLPKLTRRARLQQVLRELWSGLPGLLVGSKAAADALRLSEIQRVKR